MAPLWREVRSIQLIRRFDGVNRAALSVWTRNAGPRQARDASVTPSGSVVAAPPTPYYYIGVGAGVGTAILLALIFVLVLIARQRTQHRRLIAVMELDEAAQMAQRQEIGEVPRPAHPLRCSTLNPLHARAGWGALSSDETLHEPQAAAQAGRRGRDSISLPKKFKKRGILLKKLKRLTAILESPRSKTTVSPALPPEGTMPTPVGPENITHASGEALALREEDEDDVFVRPGSPKPDVLPSFAIRSPGRYGAGIANNDNPRASRSMSVGAKRAIPAEADMEPISLKSRPPMHARSISLGAFSGPPTRPPSGPVPSLPVIAPRGMETENVVRQGMCVSRMSSSSHESASSSVLVMSPILDMNEQKSPSLEEVVAQEDNASLQTVATKQWQSPLGLVPDQIDAGTMKEDLGGLVFHTSIRSNIAHYSAESLAKTRSSSISASSSDSVRRHLSTAQIGQADQISMSRVSSSNSLGSGIRKVTTPRKARGSSVSTNGSPMERKKNTILRDISSNSIAPSRQLSIATEDSERSSNGNPFQWDLPLQKPSALKGSPNARKGHRRQNCVRISTLTPQILGPPPSRSTSPSIMHGIEEESGDGDEAITQPGVRFVSNHRLSRPPSACSFAPNLRLQKLRASLTPSSPTLSAWNVFQEHGLPSLASDSQLSVSTATRSMSRQSNRSSLYSIPTFPSPIKSTVSPVQLSQPVPEFYLSRPSTDIDEDEGSSPFVSQLSSDPPELPSSHKLPISQQLEYDPTHPIWHISASPLPKEKEYDPASPAWDNTEPERSSGSAFFQFAQSPLATIAHDEVSPHSRPISYGGDLPDTPPVSPKTMPEGFQAFFDRKDSGTKPLRGTDKLTSANASTIMAHMPSKVDFPGAPVLLPPQEPESYSQITLKGSSPRERAASNAAYLIPMRPAPHQDDACMPSPLHISGKPNPQDPRFQPAQSVLKNAMVLRRMNSETNDATDRASRRYVRLGREASPLLPWIANPDPSESCGNMNDLFDFDFASAGAEQVEKDLEYNDTLDQIDMNEVERKLEGAIAGFHALPNPELPCERKPSCVWELGDKYWEQNPHLSSWPLPVQSKVLTKQAIESPRNCPWLSATPGSIQNTPKSLYDSDGFLRT